MLAFLEIGALTPSGYSASFVNGKKVSLKEGYLWRQLSGVEGTFQFLLARGLCLLLALIGWAIVLGLVMLLVGLFCYYVLWDEDQREAAQGTPPANRANN